MLGIINFGVGLVCLLFLVSFVLASLTKQEEDRTKAYITGIGAALLVMLAIWTNISTNKERESMVAEFMNGKAIFCTANILEAKRLKISKQDRWHFSDDMFSNEELGYKIHIQNCSKEF